MEGAGWREKTICIVDDDESIQDIYRTKFVNEGFIVIVAANGEEGVRLIKSKRPDVILLDIQMPVLDGLGVLRILKEDAELTKIPVVVLSNIDDDTVFQRVEELSSAQYYLIKSLTEAQKVVDIVLKALGDKAQ